MEVDLKRFVAFPDVQKKAPKGKKTQIAGQTGDHRGLDRSFQPLVQGDRSEAMASHRRALAIHDLALTQLEALRGLQTELDLNFQSISAKPKVSHAEPFGAGSMPAGGAPTLQVELRPYPFGTSKKKAGQQPVLIQGNVPYVVTDTKGDRQWHSRAKADGTQLCQLDIEDTEPLRITLGDQQSPSRSATTLPDVLGSSSGFGHALDKSAPILARNLEAHLVGDLTRRSDGVPSDFQERVQTYLRDLRAVLRLVVGIAPPAAKLLESCIKGLLLAFDEELTVLQAKESAAAATIRKQGDEDTAVRTLRRKLDDEMVKAKEFEAAFSEAESRTRKEKDDLQFKIDELNQIVQELSPSGDLDSVSQKMGKLAELLNEMEDEGKKQTELLREMGRSTLEMVCANKEDRVPMKDARVVELEDGAIVLRPYKVNDVAAGVDEEELSRVNPQAPVRICPLRARRLLATYSSSVPPVLKMEDLDGLLDRLYSGKLAADALAEKAREKPLPLLDFLVEHYATDPDIGLTTVGELKAYSALHLLQTTPYDDLPTHAQLFARFLMFCPVEEALPPPVLKAALEGKKHIGTSFPREAIPIARAWEAALKAIPGLGPEGFKALFQSIAHHGDFDDPSPDRKPLQCFNVLMFDKAQTSKGPLQEMLQRCELGGREEVTVNDFKAVLKDAGLNGVDDSVWRGAYADSARAGQIATDNIGDAFKAAVVSFPKGSVTEAGMMSAIADAFMGDFHENAQPLRRELDAQRSPSDGLRWSYGAIKTIVQTVTGGSSEHELRSFFRACVELSQSCTQADNPPVPMGQVVAVENRYGGDLLPDDVIVLAACQTQILEAHSGKSAMGSDTPRTNASEVAKAAAAEEAAKAKSPKKGKK